MWWHTVNLVRCPCHAHDPIRARLSPINLRLAVIRFRTTSERPRNWLSRSEQWRLLLLVVSLGLVILLISEIRKPQRWGWFRLLTGEDDASGADHERTPGQEIDTRVRPPATDNPDPDVFISPAPAKPNTDTARQLFPGVKPEYFEPVADHKVFHAEDHRAWFHLLDILADHDTEALELASTGEVSFGQLFEQPEVYRGRLVTIRGTARRVIPIRTNSRRASNSKSTGDGIGCEQWRSCARPSLVTEVASADPSP